MHRTAVVCVALACGMTGCHTAGVRPADPRDLAVTVARAAAQHTAAGNRAATAAEARRLLALAPVPDGAKPTSQRPAALDGPALGTPSTSSLIDEHRFLHVDQPVDAVWSYLKAHGPTGLQHSGSSSADGPTGVTSEGLSWSEPDRSFATWLQLEVSVAPGAHGRGTVIRADGMGEWLDPRPVRDTASGPRMRVTAAGGCPRTDRSTVGVTSDGADLSKRLLPDTRPTGALICEYGGLNASPVFSLGRSARLNGAGAGDVADRYLALPVAHTDGGETSCPMDDDSINVIALSYPGRGDVDLWAKANGCAAVSNGHVVVGGRVDLSRWIAPLNPGG